MADYAPPVGAEGAFDPFKERQPRAPRRTRAMILQDKEAKKRDWDEMVDKPFRAALESLQWPDYVSTDQIRLAIQTAGVPNQLDENVLMDACRTAMCRMGYVPMLNVDDCRGRFWVGGARRRVYRKTDAKIIRQTALHEWFAKEFGL